MKARPLSLRRWKVNPPKFGKFRDGSVPTRIAKYFLTPTKPADAVPLILTEWTLRGWEFPPSARFNPRSYIQQCVYALYVRGLMEISE